MADAASAVFAAGASSAAPSGLAPPGPPDVDEGDLDERIQLVERQLIERQHRLRRKANGLVRRARQSVRPTRLVAPVLGGALAVGALWWWWRDRGRGLGQVPAVARAAADFATPSAPPDRGAGFPWVSLLGLAWPLVPHRWRSRVSPGTAGMVLSIAMPVVQGLLRRGPSMPLATMPNVDLGRYAGTWYEVARLPAGFESVCAGQPIASYAPRPDGLLEVLNRCSDEHGVSRAVRGVARPVAGSGGAKLEVSFWPEWLRWLPLAWGDYWILHVDEHYREALVGNPDRDFLWILSRQRDLSPQRLQALVQIAQDRGYDVHRLRYSAPD